VEAALAICRFAHFLSAMVAFGSCAYLWLFAPPALRGALASALRGPLMGAGIVLVVSVLAWLALQSAGMSGDWSAALNLDALRDVLVETAFGPAWLTHFLVCLALAAAFALRGDYRWRIRACLAALALASLSLTGHASMQTGALGVLHRANDAVHLICAGAWLGGLPPFLICLAFSSEPNLRRDALTAMMRFSTSGHVAVPLLILTGIANVALISGALPTTPSTPYRALLLVKVVLVAIMVGLALFNRYALVPRLGPDLPAQKILRVTCLEEVALGVIVVGLVSVFGLLDPR
jgi:copper resistance protein D